MKTLASLFCAAVAALILPGCATINTVTPADQRTTPNLVNDKRIITDSSVASIAYVSQITEARVGDLLRVQVMIQNMKAAGRTVNYRFQWYDQQGMAVGTPVQHTTFLEGGQIVPIGETATSPQAVTWQVNLAESVAQTPGITGTTHSFK